MIPTATPEGVFLLTLDRPDRGNALSGELVEKLLAELDLALRDPSVHTILVQGQGAHFCTGFDLGDLDDSSDGDLLWRFVRIELLLSRLWLAPVRTLAIAQGRTWGAGADLFAMCDERICFGNSTMRFPGAGFGLVLGTRRLAERVGPDLARRWVSQGMQIDAATAISTGLATQCAADAPPLAQTLWQSLTAPPRVDRETNAAIRRATRVDLADQDLAALVRSAARPGLGARIQAYRDAMRAANSKGQAKG